MNQTPENYQAVIEGDAKAKIPTELRADQGKKVFDLIDELTKRLQSLEEQNQKLAENIKKAIESAEEATKTAQQATQAANSVVEELTRVKEENNLLREQLHLNEKTILSMEKEKVEEPNTSSNDKPTTEKNLSLPINESMKTESLYQAFAELIGFPGSPDDLPQKIDRDLLAVFVRENRFSKDIWVNVDRYIPMRKINTAINEITKKYSLPEKQVRTILASKINPPIPFNMSSSDQVSLPHS